MDQQSFERMLLDEGYKPVEREIEAGLSVDEHDHAWDTKGLVLRGSFTIDCGGGSRTYGVGQIFEVGAGVAHTEGTGDDGAHILVGRRVVEN